MSVSPLRSERPNALRPFWFVGHELYHRAVTDDACDALLEAAGDAKHLLMPHRTHPAFLLGMQQCGGLAREVLGPPVSGLGSMYYSRSAGLAGHRDNDYVQALPGAFMSVWLALAPVTERNGPMVIDGKPVLCGKGDAILIDGDAWHRSCAGLPGERRPVALFTYIKSGSPFRPGRTQQRSEVPL